jgi:rhodanese-related sulfurtransferase
MTAHATINSQHLSDRLSSAVPPRVLDVRTPGEFETAHIAGAYNVPLDLLREHRDEIVKHLDNDVVLVCRSGQRAAQAEETLRNVGLTNVQARSFRAGLAHQMSVPATTLRYVERRPQGLDPESAGADSTVRTVDGCRGLVNVQPARPQTNSQWRAHAATEPVGTNSTTTWPTAVLNE